MKKALVLVFLSSLVLLSSCGEMQSSSDTAQPVPEKPADSIETLSKDEALSCVLYYDNNEYHSGKAFDDDELVQKVQSFEQTVKDKYEPAEDLRDKTEIKKGSYVKCVLADREAASHTDTLSDSDIILTVYIADPEDNYVRINDKTYYTADGESKDFCGLLTEYKSTH